MGEIIRGIFKNHEELTAHHASRYQQNKKCVRLIERHAELFLALIGHVPKRQQRPYGNTESIRVDGEGFKIEEDGVHGYLVAAREFSVPNRISFAI